MQYRLILKLLLAVLFAHSTFPLLAQAVPDAVQGVIPLVVGAGVSDFIIDWGDNPDGHPRQMQGVTVWVDWNFQTAAGLLSGLGLELEGRDIDWNLPPSLSNAALHDMGTNMRQDTGIVGPIYTVRRYKKIHPYAKFLAGMGSIDFQPLDFSHPDYRHDTRSIWAAGGGLEYRAGCNFWIRGDYEYQWWPNLFGRKTALTPNGGTLGVVYHFSQQ